MSLPSSNRSSLVIALASLRYLASALRITRVLLIGFLRVSSSNSESPWRSDVCLWFSLTLTTVPLRQFKDVIFLIGSCMWMVLSMLDISKNIDIGFDA